MVKLKLLKLEDLEFLLEVRNDVSTRSQLENDSVYNLDQAKKWFTKLESPWFIIINENNERVGYFRTDGCYIGCDIHPKFRRMGYAKSAYLNYLENKDYAELFVFETNHAKKLYISLGFKETGEFKIIRDRKYLKMIYKNES